MFYAFLFSSLLSLLLFPDFSLCMDVFAPQIKPWIQNPNFTPKDYQYPGWYQSIQISSWTVSLQPSPHNSSWVYISDWKHQPYTKQGGSTLLRMGFTRNALYSQQVSAEYGYYTLTALLIALKQHALNFTVEVGNKAFTTQLHAHMTEPQFVVVAKYYVMKKTSAMKITLHERKQFESQGLGLFISNLKIDRKYKGIQKAEYTVIR